MANTAPPTLTLDAALEQAVAHQQAGRLHDAEQLYRAILQAAPDQPDANHNLGLLAGQFGQHAAGLPFLKAALELNPAEERYSLSYADALLSTGHAQDALAVMQTTLQRGLSTPAAHAMLQKVQAAVQSSPAPGTVPTPTEKSQLIALFNAGNFAELENQARLMTAQYPQAGFAWGILSASLHMQGKDALPALQKTAQVSPNDAAAQNNLGNALKDRGQLDGAVASYRRALAINADLVEAHSNLGNALLGLGQTNEALACYRRALKIKPDFPEVRRACGHALQSLGYLDELLANCQQALVFTPNCTETHLQMAIALRTLGRLEEAATACYRAAEIDPNLAAAHSNLGIVLGDLGQFEQAAASCRRALAINPDSAAAHSNLGNALRNLGQYEQAASSYRRALAIEPAYADAHCNLGNVLLDLGQPGEAIASFRQALELNPDFAEAHNNLGNILLELGQLDDAVASLRRAVLINPDFAEAHSNLGSALRSQGQLEDALTSLQNALAIKPDHAVVHSNLLFIHNYLSDQPPARLLAASKRFGELVAQTAHPYIQWPKALASDRCLRVGFVSGDLKNHPVGFFLESVLAALAANAGRRIELVAYPSIRKEDEVTARLKTAFTDWKPLADLSDEAAARMIQDDGVHILIDLAGHTADNRLPLFAWKPAPVQVSWLGYFATTGVAAIDYLVADPWTLPATQEEYFTEKIWRLPQTRLCFTAPDAAVPVSPLPALTNHFVTFGCFNNPAKMNDRVVALWARVLQAVPHSRLLLKATQFKEPLVRQRIGERFAACGIAPERLMLEGSAPRVDYLAAYQRMDIALDPFPYTGGTTSVEGLWMGVPVLTLSGDRFLSRQGVGMLMNAGLPEWIASDADDYVAKAVAQAGDLQRLAMLRQQLRQLVLSSPLFDATGFAQHFETALSGMWTAFLQKA